MKNYDERIESIFRKYNEKLEEKRRKTAFFRRSVLCTASLCAALIVCFFALKSPSGLLDEDNSNIISGNVPAAVVTTDISTSTKQVTTAIQSSSDASVVVTTVTKVDISGDVTIEGESHSGIQTTAISQGDFRRTVTTTARSSVRTVSTVQATATTAADSVLTGETTTVNDTGESIPTTIVTDITVTTTREDIPPTTTTFTELPGGACKPPSNGVTGETDWSLLRIDSQYPTAFFNEKYYFSENEIISDTEVTRLLGETELTGYDAVNSESHYCTAEVYAISDVSSDIAVALKFEGVDAFFRYQI